MDVEGLLNGFNIDPILKLVKSVNIPIVYSGGITTIEDVKKLSKTGVKGIVIGSALYKDKIKIDDALKYQSLKGEF